MHAAQSARPRRPVVLHISADFPDPLQPAKTPVIERLIAMTGDRYDHRVLSLNRRTPAPSEFVGIVAGRADPVDANTITAFAHGTAIEYLAPPRGVLHAAMLRRLANWITDWIATQDFAPDLVIGHKLTVEGLLAEMVAQALGVPYALTIQGNTDQKILRARPDLRATFRRVYHGAACVFSFAPWGRRAVERAAGARPEATIDLPCPTTNDTLQAPAPGGTAVISVFHLRNHRIKNLAGLAAAARGLAREGNPCPVHIYGGGDQKETADCASTIAGVPGMALMGPRGGAELGRVMNGAIAMAMPSRRETFGLVFVEALFAGVPIIYPADAAVDGYFDNLPFALRVNARDTRAIQDAIAKAVHEEAELKAALAEFQQAGGLAPFTRAAIAAQFAGGLDLALTPAPQQPPR